MWATRRSFPPKDGRLKLEALFWLVVVRLSLATRPFPRTLDLHKRTVGFSSRESRADDALCARVEHAVARVARFVPGSRCLSQALAGQVVLGRHGVSSKLRIGVARRGNKRLVAHAWLEKDGGVILGGRGDGEYTPLKDPRDLVL